MPSDLDIPDWPEPDAPLIYRDTLPPLEDHETELRREISHAE